MNKQNPKNNRHATTIALAVGATLLAASSCAFAGDPLSDGPCGFYNMLKGRWLFGFALAGIMGVGIAVMYGGELSDMMKKAITIIAVIGIIIGSPAMLTLLFPSFTPC